MIPYDKIEAHIAYELRRLEEENALLKSWVNSDEEDPRCCVCGNIIKGLSLQRKLRPFVWCSRKCFEWKPRKIIHLERRYGADILDILKDTSRSYGGLNIQVEALGISVPYFITIVRKYSESGDYLQFMAKHTVGEKRKGYAHKLNERTRKKETFKKLVQRRKST